jgi:hypothetical protein
MEFLLILLKCNFKRYDSYDFHYDSFRENIITSIFDLWLIIKYDEGTLFFTRFEMI